MHLLHPFFILRPESRRSSKRGDFLAVILSTNNLQISWQAAGDRIIPILLNRGALRKC